MKRQAKPTADELARAIWDSPPPRSQAEWRATSRAMREARRALGPGREYTRTISIRCGSLHRRGYRRRYIEGSKDSRLGGAKQFAARSREEGADPTPVIPGCAYP